jgi:hypothetical protein
MRELTGARTGVDKEGRKWPWGASMPSRACFTILTPEATQSLQNPRKPGRIVQGSYKHNQGTRTCHRGSPDRTLRSGSSQIHEGTQSIPDIYLAGYPPPEAKVISPCALADAREFREGFRSLARPVGSVSRYPRGSLEAPELAQRSTRTPRWGWRCEAEF